VKLPDEAAVPEGVPTRTLPVEVPLATTAVIWVALSTVKLAAALPLKVTTVAAVRFVPVMTTEVPATPEVGAKLEMVGIPGGGGGVFEVALPQPAIVISSTAESATSARRAVRVVPLKRCNLLKENAEICRHARIFASFAIPYC